jgi:hypothetical protein
MLNSTGEVHKVRKDQVDVKLVNETPGELHFELHSNQTSSLWENLKNVIESKGALVPAIQQQTSQGLSFSNPTANKSVPSSRTPKLCLVTGQKKKLCLPALGGQTLQ